MKTAVIISGGDINSDFALAFLEKHPCEYLIGADRGIRFLRQQNRKPTHIVGDFDSAQTEDLTYFSECGGVEIHTFRPEKDYTDTQIAVELALSLGSGEIYILGGMGKRIDHLLANIRVLSIAAKRDIPCWLLDEYNRIQVSRNSLKLEKSQMKGTYISLFALGGPVEGLTLTGFKYPLTDYRMTGEDPVGVSNELIKEQGKIAFRSGMLVIAESSDQEML